MKSATMILVLTVTTTLSGVVLSCFNLFAAPLIAAHKQNQLEGSISSVLPGCASYDKTEIDGHTFYLGKDNSGEVTHLAFKASGKGYQSKIMKTSVHFSVHKVDRYMKLIQMYTTVHLLTQLNTQTVCLSGISILISHRVGRSLPTTSPKNFPEIRKIPGMPGSAHWQLI